MKIYSSMSDLIGNTPLIECSRFAKYFALNTRILIKAECFNPSGSAKDRVALQMILDAEKNGFLKKGSTIIEPTSGNTGIGLASIAAERGYRAIFTMPETMSMERRLLLRSYGAEIVLTKGSEGMAGAIREAKRLCQTIENSFMPDQFSNHSNSKAHFLTTGREIWEDTDGKLDVFISAVGTGGTITGTGSYLKQKNPKVHIVAVEPKDSPVLSGGVPGSHEIQGIGAGFIPDVLNTKIPDEIFCAETCDSFEVARIFAKTEGLLVGISSGAALSAAVTLSRKQEFFHKTFVVICVDSGERYLSTNLYQNT